MIPLKLSLKNFLSYGPQTQTVDFEAHQFICLCGRNGHGKSALLDAMTWALWGQARKVSGQGKSDELLMHLGQECMMVCFEFMSNAQTYRVRRELCTAKARAGTTLDFGLLDPVKGTYVTLNEKTCRATQEKIVAVLGTSYELFSNSIFLRQGASAEFSKKTPKERKEILCELLALDIYEQLKKRALEQSKLLENRRQFLISGLRAERDIETKKGEIATQLAQLKEHEATLAERIHLQQAAEQARAQERSLLEQQRMAIDAQVKQQLAAREEFEKIMVRARDVYGQYARIRSLQGNTASRDNTASSGTSTQGHEAGQSVDQLAAALQACQDQQACHVAVEQALAKIKGELEACEKRCMEQCGLQVKHAAADRAVKDRACSLVLAKKQVALEQRERLRLEGERVQEHVAACGCSQDERVVLEQIFERSKRGYQRLVARGQEIKKALDRLQKETESVQKLDSVCSHCKQVILPQQKDFLITRIKKTKHRHEHQIDKLRVFLTGVKSRLEVMHERLMSTKELDSLLSRQHSMVSERDSVEKSIELLDQEERCARAALDRAVEAEKQVELLLSSKAYVREDPVFLALVSQIDALTQQLGQIDYKPQAHQALVRDYAYAVQIQQKEHMRHTLRELCARARQLRVVIPSGMGLDAQYRDLDQKIKTCEADWHVHKQELELLLRTRDGLERQKGVIDGQLMALQARECEIASLKAERVQIETELEDYETLSLALGKEGIQALLIEEAIPELEAETNELLAKLTDSQAQLRIDSLKDLKSGKTKETLDITISDNIGVRPYEMFSGGEAFRIDFALRIALSKLLARRSGTTLQTLIIDEGFGSQDEEGLNRIIEALYKVQESFAKIIVISHLPALKNQFQTHFMVTKEARGSVVSVITGG